MSNKKKVKWLPVHKFRVIGDRIGSGHYIGDLSYFTVKVADLKKLNMEFLVDDLQDLEGKTVNIHYGSGLSTEGRSVSSVRYELIKQISDDMQERYGVRLWVSRDLDDSCFV